MRPPEQSFTDVDGLRENANDIDTLYDVLSHEHRRFVIFYLRNHDSPIAVADIARAIASWEDDSATDQEAVDRAKSVYISLHHRHIPKMADAGVIECNQDRKTVTLTENDIGDVMVDR